MKLEQKILKDRRGFTLLEMIVSLFIITMLTGIFLANYRGGSRVNQLLLAAQLMESRFREAQNLSLGTAWCGCEPPSGGWGIHFEIAAGTTYVVFGDENNNLKHDDYSYPGLRIYNLPAGVFVDNINIGGADYPTADITFLTPEPTVRIFDGAATSTEATIRLKEIHSGRTKSVKINLFGTLEIID